MPKSTNIFTTIRTEGALLPADLLGRISEGANLDGLTPESYHRPGEKLNEAINHSWNALQGVWASFRAAQERLPENDLGTTITRERWLLPLFRELDYGRLQTATAVEIEGRSYPISHGWEYVPIHLVSYKLELDKRTPGVAGASSASPHSLVQVFLNRSDNNLWGFVSNGTKLRILRDNLTLTRQAYVEFDLEAMMDGEVYSDFVLLWLLCHQSRVEGERPSDCWLEKWMKVAEDQGTRALDQLRNGVEAAITALGLGFLEYPANAALRDRLSSTSANALNAQDYYRQLLRIVYRLLFLFVAEDRDLLLNPDASDTERERYNQYYSTQRLRRMAEAFKGTRHPDLFEGLRLVMQLLSGESPHPKSFSQGEKDLLRRGTKDAEQFEKIASQAMVQISRDLRQRQTPAEEIMWEALRDRRLNNLKFRRQHPVAETRFVADFLCYEAKLVIEIDGGIHNQQQDEDAARQTEIESLGYRVIRFTNDDVFNDLQWVLAYIAHLATLPSPGLSQGERNHPLRHLGEGGRGDEGHKALGLVPLGSFLFSDRAVADVIDCQISNQHLLETVRALSLVYDDAAKVYRSVDYKNLGPEELGSIYESLLELHPQINVPARQFVLATAGGNERKTTGSYYTPTSLINALLDSALDPVLAEAVRGPHPKSFSQGEKDMQTGADRLPSTLGRGAGGEGQGGQTPEQRILSLKICDPACGSGHFLIAAANRMAKRLAEARTGEEEPAPAAIQEAKRDIIGHCIYGVDINPMAVELCKVNLWMEALEPGKPLNFLDHRIQVGNSLLGTTPRLMAGGIPDDAFQPIEGDDPKYTATMKKQNREERKQREAKVRQLDLFGEALPANYRALHDATLWIDRAPDETLAQVRLKERMYQEMASDPEYVKARLLADAWCAAFVWEKRPPSPDLSQGERNLPPSPLGRRAGDEGYFPLPMTDLLYRRLEENPLAENLQAVREYVVELTDRYQFFHWHVAFPDVFEVPPSPTLPPQGEGLSSPPRHEGEGDLGGEGITGWQGGFDAVLGNPPWERIKIQEKEWFAERAPEIAAAPNAAARRKMIAELAERGDPYLLQAFADDKRKAEGESHFVRVSDRYPLCGRGDVNTYTIFAETARHIINGYGRVGMIVPSGIATDSGTQYFFRDLIETASLASLYSFENEEKVFPNVHNQFKFCLLTLTGAEFSSDTTDFIFFARQANHLEDEWRHFQLSYRDIASLNPNTKTVAIFRSGRDAEITKSVYNHIPILIDESTSRELNSWKVQFFRMLDMSNDSELFHTQEQLPVNDSSQEAFLPLFEARLMYHFDHRYTTYAGATQAELNAGRLPNTTSEDKVSPHFAPLPRYWVSRLEVDSRVPHWDQRWFIAYRDITTPTNERTAIWSIIPYSATAVHLMLPMLDIDRSMSAFLTNFNTFAFDYVVRQKIGGTHLNFFYVKQFPVIPPHTYTPALLDFIVPRVLELTYTAWDLQPFAQDVGYDGPPFIWDEERRFLMRCELDALYFHLYQIARDDVDYIMETFPIVKRKDVQSYGSYFTKDTILEMYDQMAALPVMHVPAPKDEAATYEVPDVSQWVTWLSPGPADERAAHGMY